MRVHRLPVSRQRHAQTAQQQPQKRWSDFHYVGYHQMSTTGKVGKCGQRQSLKLKFIDSSSGVISGTQRCFLTAPCCCSDPLPYSTERARCITAMHLNQRHFTCRQMRYAHSQCGTRYQT
ncbi:hypothetical protein CgunFtcFv8_025808 [Champsocephalus gunnari]|uniref:Uncharacterized protein n=1 Tax=Champsocephalus gunnari TaxID=52237 RepID=A0AAN8CB48_CHAGU|nr:hypothetical protein CgunFtcFv8_025808 [Champsocephalus gunnari]